MSTRVTPSKTMACIVQEYRLANTAMETFIVLAIIDFRLTMNASPSWWASARECRIWCHRTYSYKQIDHYNYLFDWITIVPASFRMTRSSIKLTFCPTEARWTWAEIFMDRTVVIDARCIVLARLKKITCGCWMNVWKKSHWVVGHLEFVKLLSFDIPFGWDAVLKLAWVLDKVE